MTKITDRIKTAIEVCEVCADHEYMLHQGKTIVEHHEGGSFYVWAVDEVITTMDTANGEIDTWDSMDALLDQLDCE